MLKSLNLSRPFEVLILQLHNFYAILGLYGDDNAQD